MNAPNSASSSAFIQVSTAMAAAMVTWGLYQYMTYDQRWWWKKRASQQGMEVNHQPKWEDELIHGFVAPGWEKVREEFVQNFRSRGELGAAVCIFYQGEKVVDLWGGYRNRKTEAPWKKDTICPIFSTSKGISAFALLMLTCQGKLNLNEKVTTYWPEFGQNGKEDITVMELIDHSVGVAGIAPPIKLEMLQHEDSKALLRKHLAETRMEWSKAGDFKGYMAVMLGFFESVIVQLTEGKSQRTIGQYLHDEAFVPLDIANEIFIGLPDCIADERIARIDGMSGFEPLWPTGSFPAGFMQRILLQPNSYTARAFRNPQLSLTPGVMDYDRRDVQRTEIPAANGMATARAIAAMYSAAERAINAEAATNPLRLNKTILQQCLQPARPGRKNGWIDEVIGIECCMGAGFLLPPPKEGLGTGRFVATPAGFGTMGAGGSFGYCDPEAGIAYSYVMNRCGSLIVDDPREFSLRSKMYEAVQKMHEKAGQAALNIDQLRTPHYLSKQYMEAHPELAPLSFMEL